MANRIQIRHGNSTPITSSLLPYELGWDVTHHILYINEDGTIKNVLDGSNSFLQLIGGTMTGNIIFSNADIGIQRPGRSKSWAKGRDGALVKNTTISGYSALASMKTLNGSWEFGTYNSTTYTDDLIFSYVTDTKYEDNDSYAAQIKFLEDGTIVANLQGTASKLATARSLKTKLDSTTAVTFDGSADQNAIPVTGTLGAANGGTGKTSLQDAANALINALSTGSSTPVDADYYVSQYVSGGTTTTTYLRRPMSALYTYIQGKADTRYVLKAGDTMTGTLKLVSSSGVYNEGNSMFYWLSGSTSSYQKQAAIFTTASTVNSKKVCERFYFREYSHNSSTGAAIEQWDQYRLPAVTADKTSANTYEILTSKSAVTIAQGGTGATTAGAAANNLLLGLPAWTSDPNDDTYFIRRDASGGNAFGQVKASTIYNYIAGKTTVSNTWTAGTTAGPTIKTTVNGVAGTAVAIPSASTSASGVVTTGAQTFAGIKTFTNPETINTTGNGAAVNFKFSNAATANETYGQNWISYDNTSGRFYWREWSGSSEGRTNYYEQYRLPACNASRTSNATYNIITTKNPADLGYYLPLTGGTVTGTLVLSKTTDASGTANNSPALIIGGAATAAHIEIDGNEILAKSNDTTPSILYLQDGSGTVTMSGTGGFNIPYSNLKVGNAYATSSSSHALWGTGITISDTRYDAISVTSLSKAANFFFSNNGMPSSNWWSGLHVAGWTGDYNAWELAGPSHGSDQRTQNLCMRVGRTTDGWGAWRAIITSSDTTSRRIFVTTSDSVPLGAVNGDIVLVKVS